MKWALRCYLHHTHRNLRIRTTVGCGTAAAVISFLAPYSFHDVLIRIVGAVARECPRSVVAEERFQIDIQGMEDLQSKGVADDRERGISEEAEEAICIEDCRAEQ